MAGNFVSFFITIIRIMPYLTSYKRLIDSKLFDDRLVDIKLRVFSNSTNVMVSSTKMLIFIQVFIGILENIVL